VAEYDLLLKPEYKGKRHVTQETPTQAGASIAPDHTNDTKRGKLNKLIGAVALGGGIGVVLIAFAALTLARYDVIEKITGFMTFMTMLIPAGVVAGIAVIGLIVSFITKSGPRWQAAAGLVLSAALLLVIYTQVMMPGGSVPPIHDITTDLDDPPQFAVLDRPATSTGPFSIEEWRAFHTDAYADIEPILLDKSPAEALADARVLAEERGWDIVNADPETGILEATAYAGYLRFRDDVVIEVTPVEDGSTRLDMRSVSQVGVSDLGYNAARIREFLADLQAG